jgi:DNA-binding NarL/FixJ family response regulator
VASTFTERRPASPRGSERSVQSLLAELAILLRRVRVVVEELRLLVPDASAAAADDGPAATLTTRQREVLGLLAEGHSTAAIATHLWLSHSTVRNHVSAILRALDAHSRLEAVARARSLGLVE